MKNKVFSFGLLLVVCFSLAVSLSSCGTKPKKESVAIISDELTEEEYAVLKNKEYYAFSDDGPTEFTLTDQPILRYNLFLYPDQMEQSLEDIVPAKVSRNRWYIVFDEKPIIMKTSGTDPLRITIRYLDAALPFVRDVLNIKPTMKILGTRCKVRDVFLTNGCDDPYEVLVYYDTDQGVFVRYYKDETSSGEWFTGRSFADYAHKYNEYLRENAYNDSGEPLSGQLPFRDYLDRIRTEENR